MISLFCDKNHQASFQFAEMVFHHLKDLQYNTRIQDFNEKISFSSFSMGQLRCIPRIKFTRLFNSIILIQLLSKVPSKFLRIFIKSISFPTNSETPDSKDNGLQTIHFIRCSINSNEAK